MKTVVQLSQELFKSGLFILSVEMTNDDAREHVFSLDQFRVNAELHALRLKNELGEPLEPIEYTLVNPRGVPAEQVLAAGESVRFELAGDLEERMPGVFSLTFPRATYRLLRGEQYSLALSWGDLVESQSVAFCI